MDDEMLLAASTEARKLQITLESDISELLTAFTRKTGLRVDAVRVDDIRVFAAERKYIVNTDITL